MEKHKLTAILVDDEPEAISYLCELLEEHKEIELLACTTDPKIAIEEINNLKPDILFLDVQMPGNTGFDIIKAVRSNSYKPHVIFTTAFEQYAIRAIKYAAFDYLLKPINAFELENAIRRISNLKDKESKSGQFARLFDKINSSQPLKFNTSTGFIVIHPYEIIYLEASRNYCELFLINNRKELVTTNMSQVSRMLPYKCFYRISRSHIINLEFLQKVERSKKACYLQADGESVILSISRSEIQEFEKMFSTLSCK
ncbi:MAG: response regulator transcription factor [Bacteroidetes bacterium]|nr:response regulator transcription factor [Bacteroidota bacterium]